METEGFRSRELCRAWAYPAMAWRWQMSAHVLFAIPARQGTHRDPDEKCTARGGGVRLMERGEARAQFLTVPGKGMASGAWLGRGVQGWIGALARPTRSTGLESRCVAASLLPMGGLLRLARDALFTEVTRQPATPRGCEMNQEFETHKGEKCRIL